MDDICDSWNFRRIIPAHYAAPVRAGPQDFRNAFSFLYDQEPTGTKGGWLGGLLGRGNRAPITDDNEDMATLNGLEKLLQSSGILYDKPRD